MGLFGDLDVESASSSLWPEDDTYLCTITESETGPSKKTENNPVDEQDIYWVLTYTVKEGSWEGTELKERQRVLVPVDPNNLTPAERRSATYIRRRLESLGIPESRMNTVTREDLIGIECAVTTRANKDDNFPPNVSKVELVQDGSSDGLSVFGR